VLISPAVYRTRNAIDLSALADYFHSALFHFTTDDPTRLVNPARAADVLVFLLNGVSVRLPDLGDLLNTVKVVDCQA
jgi:hypothetical protein